MNKNMGRKRSSYKRMPTNKCKSDRIRKLPFEDHQRINLGKKHQWMLKLVGESRIMKEIFTLP